MCENSHLKICHPLLQRQGPSLLQFTMVVEKGQEFKCHPCEAFPDSLGSREISRPVIQTLPTTLLLPSRIVCRGSHSFPQQKQHSKGNEIRILCSPLIRWMRSHTYVLPSQQMGLENHSHLMKTAWDTCPNHGLVHWAWTPARKTQLGVLGEVQPAGSRSRMLGFKSWVYRSQA